MEPGDSFGGVGEVVGGLTPWGIVAGILDEGLVQSAAVASVVEALDVPFGLVVNVHRSGRSSALAWDRVCGGGVEQGDVEDQDQLHGVGKF